MSKDHNSKEYKLGYSIAQRQRNETNRTLGNLLTQVEAVLGDTKQAEAFKDMVRWEVWGLNDHNQHIVYQELGVEPAQTVPSTTPIDASI